MLFSAGLTLAVLGFSNPVGDPGAVCTQLSGNRSRARVVSVSEEANYRTALMILPEQLFMKI
jgi:hypothetical protein